jgi:hypothetical protein
MNERIRELAEQAGHRYYPSSNSGPLRVEYLTPELEKFAELIVKECIAQCEKNAEHEWLGSGSKLSAFNIKEHFGVE